jgi:methionine sulfoxide reductase catalytic subunit
MLIRTKKSWAIVPERDVAPESSYLNRRRFLESAGLLGLGAAVRAIRVGGFGGIGAPKAADGAPADVARLYPARRNRAYTLDRPMSPEKIVSGYNNYYEFGTAKEDPSKNAPSLTIHPWEIEVAGLVERPFVIDRDALVRRMGLEERIYRHRCVEAWSIAVPWTGFPLKKLLDLARPLSSAKYLRSVSFERPAEAPQQREPWYPWPYFEGFRLDEAMHPLAFVATGMYGHELAKQNGAPLAIRMPWKYGFKSPKGIVRLELVAERPPTFWHQEEPHQYGFLSNVNPEVPHPHWSQAQEKFFGPSGIEARPTLPYNGYADLVASMYDDASRRMIS